MIDVFLKILKLYKARKYNYDGLNRKMSPLKRMMLEEEFMTNNYFPKWTRNILK